MCPDGTKQGIDDWLYAGHTWEEALQHLGSPWEGAPDPDVLSAVATKDHLPKIRLDPGQFDTIAYHAQQAILTYQAAHGPILFQHAGHLCFVTQDQAPPAGLERPPLVAPPADGTSEQTARPALPRGKLVEV